MPSIETAWRYQKAVVWEEDGTDRYGASKVKLPVGLDVRWEKTVRKVQDRKGNIVTITIDMVVDRELKVDSIVWLGDIDDLPTSPTDLYQLVDKQTVPDIKGRHIRRTVGLTRYSDVLPTVTTTN